MKLYLTKGKLSVLHLIYSTLLHAITLNKVATCTRYLVGVQATFCLFLLSFKASTFEQTPLPRQSMVPLKHDHFQTHVHRVARCRAMVYRGAYLGSV
jgi:hypothetical protein